MKRLILPTVIAGMILCCIVPTAIASESCQDWYFAEGNTLSEFETFFCLQNPEDTLANVAFQFMLETSEVITHNTTVEAHSRATYKLKDFVPEGHHVSTYVNSTGKVIVERPVYFSYKPSTLNWSGGSNCMGQTDLKTEYYFAEGTTRQNPVDGYFEEWLCLMNPHEAAVGAILTYMLENGDNITKEYQLAPTSRKTVDVVADIGINRDVSVRVGSSSPIAVERPMYFNYHDIAKGGNNTYGATAPAKEWYFADGTTKDGFEAWITIQNPSDVIADVGLTYYTTDGNKITSQKTVPPKTRNTIDVAVDVGKGKDVSVEMKASVPVVVERPTYFTNGRMDGGDITMGTSTPSTKYYVAEGTTIRGFNTYFALMNPSDDPCDVTVGYMFKNGTVQEKKHTLNPHSRATLNVADEVGTGKDVSAVIMSKSPVVFERSVYFDFRGFNGTHNVVGKGLN